MQSMGKMQLAKMIAEKKAGVDYVKFQKRDNKVLLSKKQFNEKHPVEKFIWQHIWRAQRILNLVLISTKSFIIIVQTKLNILVLSGM